MSATSLNDLVGLRFPIETEDGQPDVGLVTAVAGWSPQYVLVRTSRGQTCRLGAHLLRHLTPLSPTREEAAMPAAAEKPAKTPPAKKAAAKKAAAKSKPKSKLAKALEGDDAHLAEFLLAHKTIGDKSWTSRAGGKSRRKSESRSDFVRRALLGVETEVAS